MMAVVVAALAVTGAVNPNRALAQTTAPAIQLNAVSCLDATVCIADGTGTSAAGVDQPIIEKWTQGGGWKLMRLPSMPAGATAITLSSISCSGRDFCMALGTYLASGAAYPAYTPYGLVWHGARWSLTTLPLPSGALGAEISGLSCTGPASCLAVGYYFTTPTIAAGLVEQWNGAVWAGFEGLDMDAISCVEPSGCTAVGRVNSPGPDGNESVIVEHWAGTTWTQVATLASGDVRDNSYSQLQISCVAVRCMVAGGFTDDLGDVYPAAWAGNGGSWEGTPTPSLGGGYGSGDRYYFDRVSCAGEGRCTAVGDIFTASSGYEYVNLAERWNGSVWTVQSTPNLPGVFESFLVGVSCADGRTCLAVGNSENPTSFAERWTTKGWKPTTPIAEPTS
jgi:hypothetical protein